MKLVDQITRGITKNLFDSYELFYFHDHMGYREQDRRFSASLIKRIKRKPKSILQRIINSYI